MGVLAGTARAEAAKAVSARMEENCMVCIVGMTLFVVRCVVLIRCFESGIDQSEACSFICLLSDLLGKASPIHQRVEPPALLGIDVIWP